jgi:tetrahydromethanopterin S-methyltransferase subunit D
VYTESDALNIGSRARFQGLLPTLAEGRGMGKIQSQKHMTDNVSPLLMICQSGNITRSSAVLIGSTIVVGSPA